MPARARPSSHSYRNGTDGAVPCAPNLDGRRAGCTARDAAGGRVDADDEGVARRPGERVVQSLTATARRQGDGGGESSTYGDLLLAARLEIGAQLISARGAEEASVARTEGPGHECDARYGDRADRERARHHSG